MLSVIALSGCQTATVTPAPVPEEIKPVVYTIKKGQHDSNAPFQIRNVSSLKFEATFNASAMYETAVKENQADINKLYGVADCHTDHHTNSVRFGWRWFNDQLEIHAYTYRNKERQSKLLGVVELNKTYTYEIVLADNKYIFKLNGETVELPRNCNGKGEGYQLYPYFGGDEVAPHDVTIAIRELES
ncbi:hypothetical protein GWO68_01075 [Pontibacter sp. BT213]|uniref:Uncharacterized protein n=1 Tax=Pontibacter fetidus TaxID=2700082 RepID=A0A6B2H2F8_9BACT|nr:hypothetical protein [Pontibacter fetidus]